MCDIWFWQRIVSPHMVGLPIMLARRGYTVIYVAEEAMSSDRSDLGWKTPLLPGVKLIYTSNELSVNKLIQKSSLDAIHIFQGVRANGYIKNAQRALSARGSHQWIVMETVNENVWYGTLKNIVYKYIFSKNKKLLQGVLATGYKTSSWLVNRGVVENKIFPFAYFLTEKNEKSKNILINSKNFRFIFAGQLISRKRIDWLINALDKLSSQKFELYIVGVGPEEVALKAQCAETLGSRVTWLGQLPLPDVPSVLAQADCLVLPSMHDGWGAVASEALMAGTPVICSDTCGVADVVRASTVGGVFPVNEKDELVRLLANQLASGIVSVDKRHQIAKWATCLGATAGADYLIDILNYTIKGQGDRPVAPWLREIKKCVD